MSIWKAALLSTLIPLTALPAIAQDGPRGQDPMAMFEMFDLDGDGTITRAEVEAAPEARFETADANGDGVLDRDELIAQASERAEAAIPRGIDRLIERADADGTGTLTLEEMQEARADARDGRRGPGGRGMPEPGEIFERVDADDDGVVTQDEFEAAMAEFRERRDGRRFGPRWGDRG